MAAWLLLLCATPTVAAPLSFDPRDPQARLLVEAKVEGERGVLIVDTGAGSHAVAPGIAHAAHLALSPPVSSQDWLGHPIVGNATSGTLEVDGHAQPNADLFVTDFARVVDVVGTHSDGLFSPQNAVDDEHAIRIDIPGHKLELLPRAVAFETSGDRALLLADVPIIDAHFQAVAHLGDRDLRMEIDTGSPTSSIYRPRSDTLPDGAVEHSDLRERVEVGRVRREVLFVEVEPVEQGPKDGLLGLDVLKDCTLVVARDRMRVTCDDVVDLGVPKAIVVPHEKMCLAKAGPCLERRVEGGFDWVGDRVAARIDARGKITFWPKSGSMFSMRTVEEERRWFSDATGALRDALDRDRDMRSSFAYLPRLLARVWRQNHRTAAQKRELVFRIWNECAEQSDPDRGAAGERARRVIDAFVKKVAPPGSKDGYSPEELELLNRRRPDGPRFEPYASHPDRDAFGSIDR